MDKKEILIKTLGGFILLYGLFAISFSIYRGKPSWIFWFCYISMILIGLGALKKDSLLIASQINLLFFYLVSWNIDFFYHIITEMSLWGITDYFFKEMLTPARIISLEHFFLLPFALILLYLIKIKRKDHWKLSIVQGLSLLLITKILTDPIYNVNCVFYSCASFLPNGKLYPYLGIGLNVISILVTAFIINRIPFFFDKTNSKKRSSRKI